MGKGTSADLKDHVARLESLLSKFKAGAEYGNASRDDSTRNGGRQVGNAVTEGISLNGHVG